MKYIIKVIGNKGYGVTYGCCNFFSWFEEHKCTYQTLGKTLYNILSHLPFEDCTISIEYNTDKSAEHPTNKDEDIVRYSFEKGRVQDKEPACNN